VDPDAEHQEDDTDLGELGRDLLVRDEARREWPQGDAEQVSDDRRQAQATSDEARHESGAQPEGDRGDEFAAVLQALLQDESSGPASVGVRAAGGGKNRTGRGERTRTSNGQLNVPEHRLRCQIKGREPWLERAG